MFLVLLLYMLFASTFTISKIALMYTTPIFFISIRMLIGGLLLLLYQYVCTKKFWSIQRDELWLLMQVSFFEYYAAFILEAWALQWITSSKACLLFNTSPFITAIISYFLIHERFTYYKISGLIIGFIGLLPTLLVEVPYEQLAGEMLHLSVPEWAMLGSVFCASYGWIVLKKLSCKGHGIIEINGLTMILAGISALFTSFIVEGYPVIIPPIGCFGPSMPVLCYLFGPTGAGIAIFLLYTLALIVIANIIGFNLYGYLLSFYSTTFMSFAGFITPFFAAIFGWLFLGETIEWSFIVTMMILFLGLLLFYRDELKD